MGVMAEGSDDYSGLPAPTSGADIAAAMIAKKRAADLAARTATFKSESQAAGYLNPAQSDAFYGDTNARLNSLAGRSAPTMTAAHLGAAPQSSAAAAMLGHTSIDNSQEAQYREGQMGLMKQLQLQAAGGGPSLAGAQLQQGNENNINANMAMLASARGGGNPAMAMRDAASNQMMAGQQLNQQMANARMQEQLNAQGALAGVTGTGRAQDQAYAYHQAGMDQAQGMANQDATNKFGLTQSLANMDMQGKYGLQQGQFDQGANGQNLSAYLHNQDAGDAQSRFLLGSRFAKEEADRKAGMQYTQDSQMWRFNQQQRDDELKRRQQARQDSIWSGIGSAVGTIAGGMAGGAGGAAAGGKLGGGVGGALSASGDDDSGTSSDEDAKEDIQPGGDTAKDFYAKMSKRMLDEDAQRQKDEDDKKRASAAKAGGEAGSSPGLAFSAMSDETAKKNVKPGSAAAYDFLSKMSAQLHPTDEHGNSIVGMQKNKQAEKVKPALSSAAPEGVQYFSAHKPDSWEAYRAAKFAEANPNYRAEAIAPYMDRERGPMGGQVAAGEVREVYDAKGAPKDTPRYGGFDDHMPYHGYDPGSAKYSDQHKAELRAKEDVRLKKVGVLPGPSELEKATGNHWVDSQSPKYVQDIKPVYGPEDNGPEAAALSDEQTKKDIRGVEASEMFKHLGAHEYKYKDPNAMGAGAGTFVSPMAQEFEKSGPIGAAMVKQGPDGKKMVDYGKSKGIEFAALAEVVKDVAELKKKVGGKRG